MFICFLSPDEEAAKKDPKYHLARTNVETENTLRELDKTYKAPTEVNKILIFYVLTFKIQLRSMKFWNEYPRKLLR